MQTNPIRAHFDGEHILLDEPIVIKPNTKLLVTVLSETEDDRDYWLRLSALSLESAYGDDEPEYTLSSVREMNPEYD